MIIDPGQVREIASRICAAAESRTGGVCAWRYDEKGQMLFFRLTAEAKVVGAVCSDVLLADMLDVTLIEREIVATLLRKLGETLSQ